MGSGTSGEPFSNSRTRKVFWTGLREKQLQQAAMITRHHEDVGGLADQFLRYGLAAERGKADAFGRQGEHRVPAGWQAATRADSRPIAR